MEYTNERYYPKKAGVDETISTHENKPNSPNSVYTDGVLTVLVRGLGSCAVPVTLPGSNLFENLQYLVTPTSKTLSKINIFRELLHFS